MEITANVLRDRNKYDNGIRASSNCRCRTDGVDDDDNGDRRAMNEKQVLWEQRKMPHNCSSCLLPSENDARME